MTGGIIDRFRSMDVPGTRIVGGHVAGSMARNAISTALLFAVAFGIGFRPHATVLSFCGAIVILLLFVLAMSWLCAAFGLLVRSVETANSAMFLMFVAYASSAFAPVRTMPGGCAGSRATSRSHRSPRPSAACSSASPQTCVRRSRSPGSAASCSFPWRARPCCSAVAPRSESGHGPGNR